MPMELSASPPISKNMRHYKVGRGHQGSKMRCASNSNSTGEQGNLINAKISYLSAACTFKNRISGLRYGEVNFVGMMHPGSFGSASSKPIVKTTIPGRSPAL